MPGLCYHRTGLSMYIVPVDRLVIAIWFGIGEVRNTVIVWSVLHIPMRKCRSSEWPSQPGMNGGFLGRQVDTAFSSGDGYSTEQGWVNKDKEA